MKKKKISSTWLLLIFTYIFFNFAYTSFFPFETMYLTHIGYKSSDVAVLSMATAIGNFLFQFVVSMLLRKQKKLGDVMMIFVGLSIPLAFLLMIFHQSLLSVILFVFPVTLFDFSCIGLLDSVAVAMIREYPEIQYSVTRVFGSLAGVLSSFLLGHLYSYAGIGWMFVIHGAVQLLTLFTLIVLKKRYAPDVIHNKDVKRDASLDEKYILLKRYFPVIIGGTMIFLGWRAIFVYLPIMIENLGGTSADFGNAMALINGSSMVIMFIFPFVRKRLGLKTILAIGSFAMALRWLLTALAPGLTMIILVQALDSFGFGFTQPAMIEIISNSASEKDRSSLISIWTGTQMALGTIMANIVVQLVSSFVGLQLSFLAFSALAVVGALLVVFACRKSH